jgi:hypothetical protein
MSVKYKLIVCLVAVAVTGIWMQQSSSSANLAQAEDPAAQPQPAAEPQDDDDKDTDDQKKRDRPLSEFMQQKLDASSEILRGLMIDDLELVEENSDKLLKMSREEKWRASNDMMYLQHSAQFGNAVDELRQKAKDKSMDGASLAWINVTMSCIQCHNWVRNTIIVDNGTDSNTLQSSR